jgi:hypothetical protein
MIAQAGDYPGHAMSGLMEIDVGLAAPIGVVEMIQHFFGGRVARCAFFWRSDCLADWPYWTDSLLRRNYF